MTTSVDTPADPQLMTPAEAARALRVTPRTIYLWIRSGKLRAIHVSERVTRIPQREIERLVGTAGGATPPLGIAADSASSLPDLSSVLWDLDPAQVNSDSHARLIIARILEAGRPNQVRWMFRRYPVGLVLDVAEHSRGLSRRTSVSWSTLLRDRLTRVA